RIASAFGDGRRSQVDNSRARNAKPEAAGKPWRSIVESTTRSWALRRTLPRMKSGQRPRARPQASPRRQPRRYPPKKFNEINEAFAVLSYAEKRAALRHAQLRRRARGSGRCTSEKMRTSSRITVLRFESRISC